MLFVAVRQTRLAINQFLETGGFTGADQTRLLSDFMKIESYLQKINSLPNSISRYLFTYNLALIPLNKSITSKAPTVPRTSKYWERVLEAALGRMGPTQLSLDLDVVEADAATWQKKIL